MVLRSQHGVVQVCQVAKVPRRIFTGEENGDKAGFSFLLTCLDGVGAKVKH